MTHLRSKKDQKIEENIIKDVGNVFRLISNRSPHK